jgi:3-oxoacyl-[acyl-carrier-protein] synthase I
MNATTVIVGVGGQNSIGLSFPAIAAAVRGPVSGFSYCEYLRDRSVGEPIKLAMLELLPKGSTPYDRMKELALGASMEALTPLGKVLLEESVALPVILSLPSARPGFPDGEDIRLVREIINELPVAIDKPECMLMDRGHAGGLSALETAREMIINRRAPACLVGGVDCYIDIETLHWIEMQERLRREDQPNGFVPGEGAAFLLVCDSEFAADYGITPLAEILGGVTTDEPRPWYSDYPTLGEGLTLALHQLFDHSMPPNGKATATYCDLNGESWRVDEWNFAYLRTAKFHGEPLDLRHPADCWGDLGAASGVFLAGFAALDLSRSHTNRGIVLVCTASDTTADRSACLLRKIDPKKLEVENDPDRAG